ncbi:hypothetical protein [Alcanivorax sp.]|uniref:hypothetical protein n=1 Tax=Alcanivorax sp. TaxID=1872427 RepID=UPI0025BB1C56|nr:hypothetical protein [Alcanivorax sp.]
MSGFIRPLQVEQAESKGKDPFEGYWYSQEWLLALHKEIQPIVQSLKIFIDKGLIKASKEVRCMEGELIAQDTWLDFEELEKWAELTNTTLQGDLTADYYLDNQTNAAINIEYLIRGEILKGRAPAEYSKDWSEMDREELQESCEKLSVEVVRLLESAAKHGPGRRERDGEVGTRRKNNYLKVIYALLELLSENNLITLDKPYKAGGQIEAKLRELEVSKYPKEQAIRSVIIEAMKMGDLN